MTPAAPALGGLKDAILARLGKGSGRPLQVQRAAEALIAARRQAGQAPALRPLAAPRARSGPFCRVPMRHVGLKFAATNGEQIVMTVASHFVGNLLVGATKEQTKDGAETWRGCVVELDPEEADRVHVILEASACHVPLLRIEGRPNAIRATCTGSRRVAELTVMAQQPVVPRRLGGLAELNELRGRVPQLTPGYLDPLAARDGERERTARPWAWAGDYLLVQVDDAHSLSHALMDPRAEARLIARFLAERRHVPRIAPRGGAVAAWKIGPQVELV